MTEEAQFRETMVKFTAGSLFVFNTALLLLATRLRRGFPVEHRPDVGGRSRSTPSMRVLSAKTMNYSLRAGVGQPQC